MLRVGLRTGVRYRELAELPHRTLVGRPSGLDRAFFDDLGLGTIDREGGEFGTVWAEVRERLDDGDPVTALVDLYYLDHDDTSTRFAPHATLLAGEDEDADANESVRELADGERTLDEDVPAALGPVGPAAVLSLIPPYPLK